MVYHMQISRPGGGDLFCPGTVIKADGQVNPENRGINELTLVRNSGLSNLL